jgi:hypothetical protein
MPLGTSTFLFLSIRFSDIVRSDVQTKKKKKKKEKIIHVHETIKTEDI